MIIWLILRALLYSFMATAFFALLMQAPKKSVIVSSGIAAVGYLIYLLLSTYFNELLGYFIGTLLIALLGEWAARRLKMPATIFIFPGVIPLVPGMGLYRTMLAMVQGSLDKAFSTGINTMLIAGTMAMAMAISAVLVNANRHIQEFKESRTPRS